MLRRLLPLILFAGLTLLHGQEAGQSEAAHEDSNMGWKIVNFIIFSGAIGYGILHFAPAFFNARSADIQKAIKDATGLKMDADLRYSEIDRKMANLSTEVNRLRTEAKGEMDREHARMMAQTKEDLDYIERSTAIEIDALRGEGADKLRVHATQQALAMAEARLRERFAASGSKELLNDFVNLVERGKN